MSQEEKQAGSELSGGLGALVGVIRKARERKFDGGSDGVRWLIELSMTDEEYDLFNQLTKNE